MIQVQPLDSSAGALLPPLMRAIALGDILCPDDDDLPERPPPEMGLLLTAETEELERDVRSAAGAILARTLGRPDAPRSDEVSGIATRLEARLDAIGDELGIDHDLDPDAAEELMGPFGELLRELGLERFDTSVMLGRSKDGTLQIGWNSADPRTADVWQLGRLFERASMVIHAHPMLRLERRASEWWLGTFRHKRFDDEFTGRVREQEWSYAEREALLVPAAPLRLLLESELAGSVPARQRRLAEAVLTSAPGIYRVVERRSDQGVVLEDVDGNGRLDVHEHNDDADYGAGALGFGRLYRLDRSTYVRSPGMVFVPREGGLAGMLRGVMREAPSDIPPSARIESVLSAVLRGSGGPRRILPARNPSEAQALLRTLVDHLQEEGLAHEVSEDQVELDPEWTAAAEASELAYRRFDVDVAVADWMTALMEQARRPGSRSGGKAKGGGRRNEASGRKARRRRRRP